MERQRLCKRIIDLLGKKSHRQLVGMGISQVSTRYKMGPSHRLSRSGATSDSVAADRTGR